MKALAAIAVCLGLVAGGCGDSADQSSVTTAPARGELDAGLAVSEWLRALDEGDEPAISRLVDRRQVLVLLSLENSIGYAQMAALDRSGIDPDTRAEYWVSFATEFATFTDSSPGDLEMIGFREYDLEGQAFAAVEVGFPTSFGTTEIMAFEQDDRWFVDLLGTFGPNLVRPLRGLLSSLGTDADADLVEQILADSVPSMRAALLRPNTADLPVDFVVETEALIGLLASGSS